MTTSLKQWARLHTVSATDLNQRWQLSPQTVNDALLRGRFDKKKGVWRVESVLEMVRLIGALQWLNPTLKLWYRGEGDFFETANPTRFRVSKKHVERTAQGIKWLDQSAELDRALRDRGPMARLAILQHYGCPTSLLDLTASYDVACAFAFMGDHKTPHMRVYALPRHQHPVTVFDAADIVLVDLNAELPSYCARPHVQQAAFLARREALYNDLQGKGRVSDDKGTLDPLCVAHIRLNFDGGARFVQGRAGHDVLYPRESTQCRNCSDTPDMNGDYLLHTLRCFPQTKKAPKPTGFPDNLAG